MTMISIDDSGSYEVIGHTGTIFTELVRDEFGKLNCQIAELTALQSLTVERDGIESVVAGHKTVKTVLAAIENFMTEIEKITEGMLLVDAEVSANAGLHCYERNSFGSCSLHLIEQVTYGE